MPIVLRTSRWDWAGHAETWKNISANSEHKKQIDCIWICEIMSNTIAIKEVQIKQQLGMILSITWQMF